MNQTNSILAYLQAGNSITPLEALQRFGCMRLGARIYDLKGGGYPIITEMVKDERTGKRYARYSMVKV